MPGQSTTHGSKTMLLSDADFRGLVSERYGADARLIRLQGDASNRLYYRVTTAAGSAILMVHEEAFREEDLPFLNVARHLNEVGSPVPEVLAAYPEQGILVLEDLGDTLLQEYTQTRSASEVDAIYREAVDLICLLQGEGTRRLTPACIAYHCALDFEKFDWELRFFTQNYVERLLGAPLSAPERKTLGEWLQNLARETSGGNRVFCHRDYHSRNLIVHRSRLYMFDFQDARWGPRTYDLASLLRDSYVELPDALVSAMIEHFCSNLNLPAAELRAEFDRVSLQRNIKALGTFAYQSTVKRNAIYLQSVPRTLNYILRNLAKFPSDSAVLEIFERHLKYENNA